MGKSAAPAPDYTGAAQATAASNLNMLNTQTSANRPDVSTPWGQQTWSQSPSTFNQADYDDAVHKWSTSGLPAGTPGPNKADYTTAGKWTSNISLTPQQQSALDDQQKIQAGRSAAAGTLLGQATNAFNTPFAWGDLPAASGRMDPNMGPTSAPSLQTSLNGSSSDYRQRAQDAIDQLQQPNLDRTRAAAETRLSNQGLSPDSEAYKSDMRDVSDNEARAHLAAIGAGQTEDSLKFGQDLSSANLGNTAKSAMFGQGQQVAGFGNQAQLAAGGFNNDLRSRAIAEEAQRRGMSLNELNALLTGQQVSMPGGMSGSPNSTAGNVAGTNYTGAATSQYGANVDQANASNAGASSTWGAVGSAALTALSFY